MYITKPAPAKQKTFQEEWNELTDQIKRLKDMQVENYAKIRKLQRSNVALTETIKQLKTKRTQLAFVSIHVREG